jgi:alpha-beta hydrolase superfamily lysophospholipase
MVFGNTKGQIKAMSTPEGRVFCRYWNSDRKAGVLIHLHGLESHSGWFSETAEALSEHGYQVYAPDRIGSGLSEGIRGNVSSWRVWLRHVRALIEVAKNENPGAPLFVAASCWAAKVGLELALTAPEQIAGLALITPALKPRVRLCLFDRLRLVAALPFDPEMRLPIPIERDTMFTDETPYVELIGRDHLRLRQATARFLAESWRLDRHVLRRLRNLTVPTLVILAERDEIVDTPAVRALFQRSCPDHITLRLFSSACHSMEFGQWRQPLCKDIISWLRSPRSLQPLA